MHQLATENVATSKVRFDRQPAVAAKKHNPTILVHHLVPTRPIQVHMVRYIAVGVVVVVGLNQT